MKPSADPRVVAALERLPTFGSYAAPEPLTGHDHWQPLSAIDETYVLELAARYRAALADQGGVAPKLIDARLAASTAHLTLVSRLLAPAVGLATLTGRWPDLYVVLRLRPDQHRVVSGWAPDSVAAHLLSDPAPLLDGPIAAIHEATGRATGLSRQIMVGNVASSLHGAASLIANQHPELAPAAQSASAPLLHHSSVRPGWQVSGRWLRRSCCLFYRAPQGGLCGDCVLHLRGT